MPYTPYGKPYRSPSELVQDLKTKNLSFLDEASAIKILSNISYYHLKIYLRPLIDSSSPNEKTYRTNELFDNGLDLYRFDEDLRFILFKAIARIEVKARSRLDHVMSSLSGNPFWFLDDQWFYTKNGTYTIDSIRNKIGNEFSNTKEDYATHYKSKYYNDVHHNYKNLPPFWIASELMSLGSILKIYKNIDLNTKTQADLDRLAQEFGAVNYRTFCTWLSVLRDVRNRCAHHSRLFSANLPAPKNINKLLSIQPLNNNRIYASLVVIHRILKSLGVENINIYDDITCSIGKYICIRPYLRMGGFPSNWYRDTFWS
ncbi:Abi family protein [Xenorhabdus nematophila]|uniref:Abi family protein n=1 Tax=Xenorhabdus nematophila TaxID=628 RepID=UPI000327545C|nr:Abi family protein [Xenorhabdus nematophila]CCW32001.1 Abi family protein [Xenorhabdus nematophila F1]